MTFFKVLFFLLTGAGATSHQLLLPLTKAPSRNPPSQLNGKWAAPLGWRQWVAVYPGAVPSQPEQAAWKNIGKWALQEERDILEEYLLESSSPSVHEVLACAQGYTGIPIFLQMGNAAQIFLFPVFVSSTGQLPDLKASRFCPVPVPPVISITYYSFMKLSPAWPWLYTKSWSLQYVA